MFLIKMILIIKIYCKEIYFVIGVDKKINNKNHLLFMQKINEGLKKLDLFVLIYKIRVVFILLNSFQM